MLMYSSVSYIMMIHSAQCSTLKYTGGKNERIYEQTECDASFLFCVYLSNTFLLLMTVFSPSQEEETNIVGAHVYFKQPTAKYTLAALLTAP